MQYYSDVDICNMALAQLKVRPIGNLRDNTEEARQCRAMFPYSLSQVLAMADWNFCKTKRRLAKIDLEYIDHGYITDERVNYFKYPVDAVKLLHVSLGNETLPPHEPFHHKHHHHYEETSEEDEVVEEMTDELDDDTDGDTDGTEKHHKHHRQRHIIPPLPKFHRELPPPRNDDGYQIQSIRLIHQHTFIEAIVTPFTRVDVEYIRYVDNPQYWPPMFTEAVVRYLSFQLATLLSGKSDAIQTQQQAFEIALRRAQAINGNDRKSTLHQRSRLLRGCF